MVLTKFSTPIDWTIEHYYQNIHSMHVCLTLLDPYKSNINKKDLLNQFTGSVDVLEMDWGGEVARLRNIEVVH